MASTYRDVSRRVDISALSVDARSIGVRVAFATSIDRVAEETTACSVCSHRRFDPVSMARGRDSLLPYDLSACSWSLAVPE